MRLWSLHPRYLDVRGLCAVWREGLLAQQVLRGATTGYRHHPQLQRFRDQPRPVAAIASYLRHIQAEAERRGYHFDVARIAHAAPAAPLPVTDGQLLFERGHLLAKLAQRDRAAYRVLRAETEPTPHPLLRVAPGPVETWEVSARRER
jgi:hypothetical protein